MYKDDNMSQKEYQNVLSQLPEKEKSPEFPGRPKNRGVINGEDIINLQIALNTAKSLKQFLEMV